MFKPSEKQVRSMVYDCRVTDNDDNSRVYVYLRHLDLSGLDLSYLDLSDVFLEWSTLHRTNLSHSNLERANLYGDALRGANLSYANLSCARLYCDEMVDVDFSHANMNSAYLHGGSVGNSNMSHVDLSYAIVKDVDLSRAKLDNMICTKTLTTFGRVTNEPPRNMPDSEYPVIAWDRHLSINGKVFVKFRWEHFTDRKITKFFGKDFLKFWKKNKSSILAL